MTVPVRLVAATIAALALAAAGAAAAGPAPAQPMRVTIDIARMGVDGTVVQSNFAVRAGGAVTLTIRNHTHVFHTFTVRALGISVVARPSRTTTVRFVAPYGVYRWRCVICTTAAHPHSHAMGGKMYAIVNV